MEDPGELCGTGCGLACTQHGRRPHSSRGDLPCEGRVQTATRARRSVAGNAAAASSASGSSAPSALVLAGAAPRGLRLVSVVYVRRRSPTATRLLRERECLAWDPLEQPPTDLESERPLANELRRRRNVHAQTLTDQLRDNDGRDRRNVDGRSQTPGCVSPRVRGGRGLVCKQGVTGSSPVGSTRRPRQRTSESSGKRSSGPVAAADCSSTVSLLPHIECRLAEPGTPANRRRLLRAAHGLEPVVTGAVAAQPGQRSQHGHEQALGEDGRAGKVHAPQRQ